MVPDWGQARIISRCGHVPYREMPEITLKAITRFVQDLWGRMRQ
jgi:hypothetical protein